MAEAAQVLDISGQPVAEADPGSARVPWWRLRSATSAQLLVAFGVERGLSPAECLRETGIATVEELADPAGEIAGWQELRIARNLVGCLGDEPALGVRVGLRYHLPAYGVFGLALMCSATARDALALGLRMRALAYGFCRPVVQPEHGSITLLARGLPGPVARFLVERDTAAWVSLIREVVPAAPTVLRVEFGFAAGAGPRAYQELLNADVTLGSDRTAVTVSREVLDLPLPHADPTLLARYERECLALLARRSTARTTSGQVLAVLRTRRGPMPSLTEVAGELRLSARTLRRRLTAEGSSFRALSCFTRQERAEQLLTRTDLSIERIAARLGYSEASPFVRAFSQRHGVSPSAYRRARQLPLPAERPGSYEPSASSGPRRK